MFVALNYTWDEAVADAFNMMFFADMGEFVKAEDFVGAEFVVCE